VGRFRSGLVPVFSSLLPKFDQGGTAGEIRSPNTWQKVPDGFQMTDQRRKGDDKDLRRHRLKAALRENLRRRKSQARQRGETEIAEAPSREHDASPHGEGGKRTD
jgi:hypothetical protein